MLKIIKLLCILFCFSIFFCESDNKGSADDCLDDSDCPADNLCNAFTGRCILSVRPEGNFAFHGSFSCTVGEDASSPAEGVSNILGQFEGDPLDFTTISQCYINTDSSNQETLRVSLFGARYIEDDLLNFDHILMSMTFFADDIFGNAELSVEKNSMILENSGTSVVEIVSLLTSYETLESVGDVEFIGIGNSGNIKISGSANPGKKLEGELDITIRGIYPSELGSSCRDSWDCDLFNDIYCLYAEYGGVCSGFCDYQSDCSGFPNTSCIYDPYLDSGICLEDCMYHSQCYDDQMCVIYGINQGYCNLDDFYSPSSLIGTPCEDSSECNSGLNLSCLGFIDLGTFMCTTTDQTTCDNWTPNSTFVPSYGSCHQDCSSNNDCFDGQECFICGAYNFCTYPNWYSCN